jgi:putative addiction module component (TIGR02574 family)
MAHPLFDFSHLSPEERIQLAEDLWDSLVPTPAALPLSEAQARELDHRVAAYRQDGDPGQPWREALDEIEREAENAEGLGRGG